MRIEVTSHDELGALARGVQPHGRRLRSRTRASSRRSRTDPELATALGELDEKSRELEAASRHKSEFLANMSHELRTPLNAILGFSQVLRERMFGELNAKQEEYLDDILSLGNHLLALINDVLDLSKVEAGQIELEVAPFSLREALERGVVMVRERATKDGVRSRSRGPEVDVVEGDERRSDR
jgi:signal transduction histidine kinase